MVARKLVRTGFIILLADLVILVAAFWVVLDIQMRLACSLPACTPLSRSSPAFAYSVLTKSFSMSVNDNFLVSPPTLDWLQVLAVAFVVVNVWYGYRIFATKRNLRAPTSTPESAQSSVISIIKRLKK